MREDSICADIGAVKTPGRQRTRLHLTFVPHANVIEYLRNRGD
jgi:hypothetical protein